MSEDDLLKAVIELAEWLGYRKCHFRPARTRKGWRTAIVGDPGWPDVAIAGHGRFILAELKSDSGAPTKEQETWHAALREAGIEVCVWSPADWESGRIAELLHMGGANARSSVRLLRC
jgi:hypothetical protein